MRSKQSLRLPAGAQLLAAVVAMGLASIASAARAEDKTPYDNINAEAATSAVSVKSVRPNVNVLEGSGGNIIVLSGKDGLLLVDCGIAVSEQKIMAALQGIEAAPIKYAINTHWHWDHTDGNAWVERSGATIVAQKNTAAHLDQTIRVEEWGHTFPPIAADGRPTVLVEETKEIDFDGELVQIRHYPPSHTDGDLSVSFDKADVLVTGDTWWNGLYPFIDTVAGGSIDGMIAAAQSNLGMSTDKTLIVPGHGPVGNKAELAEFRDMLVAIRDAVAQLKKQGKSLDQAIAAKPTAKFDAKFGQGVINPALFVSLVYRGV